MFVLCCVVILMTTPFVQFWHWTFAMDRRIMHRWWFSMMRSSTLKIKCQFLVRNVRNRFSNLHSSRNPSNHTVKLILTPALEAVHLIHWWNSVKHCLRFYLKQRRYFWLHLLMKHKFCVAFQFIRFHHLSAWKVYQLELKWYIPIGLHDNHETFIMFFHYDSHKSFRSFNGQVQFVYCLSIIRSVTCSIDDYINTNCDINWSNLNLEHWIVFKTPNTSTRLTKCIRNLK